MFMVKRLNSFNPYWLNLYPYLLSIFFVLHGFVEHFGFLPVQNVVWLCLKYLLITAGLFFLFKWPYKNILKATLATFLSLFFFFSLGLCMILLNSFFLTEHYHDIVLCCRFYFCSTLFY